MVNIAQIKTVRPPDVLCALGLGSCVGVVLYDPDTRVCGMIHVLLPESGEDVTEEGKTKFADTGIRELADVVVKAGGRRASLRAKLAGGAAVLTFKQNMGTGAGVGQRNGEACLKALSELRIAVEGKDLGGNLGRSIYFDPEKNLLSVKKISGEERVI